MNCKDIAEWTPLYLSGEIDDCRLDVFRTHLAECPGCAAHIDQQVAVDARLRNAFASDFPDAAALSQSVRGRIARERSLRWTMVTATAAVVLFALVLAYRTLRPEPLFSAAALDHRMEVVEHQPRRWRTDPADIEKLVARYELSNLAAMTPIGYRLEHAKICGIDGKATLHLVYTNGIQEFSVYVLGRAGVANKVLRTVRVRQEHLAAFQTERFEVIAAGGSSDECLQFARAAASVL